MSHVYTSFFPFFLSLSLSLCGSQGEFRLDAGYPYVTLLVNLSQMWALYCLLSFYLATQEHMRPIHPVMKFLCIKAVIFATYWSAWDEGDDAVCVLRVCCVEAQGGVCGRSTLVRCAM